MPARPGSVDEQRGEPLHPPIHSHVIHVHAALGEQHFDIAFGQGVAQVLAHRHCDHFRWETEPCELRRRLAYPERSALHPFLRRINTYVMRWA